MTEGKRNIIQGLLQEYDIETADDIQDALKDLLSETLKEMTETEMDNHLGYDMYERSEENNYRNGTKFKPAIDNKITSMYAKGMTTRQISETIENIYGYEVSESMVSDITDKLLPQIEEWQNRPFASGYPVVFIPE